MAGPRLMVCLLQGGAWTRSASMMVAGLYRVSWPLRNVEAVHFWHFWHSGGTQTDMSQHHMRCQWFILGSWYLTNLFMPLFSCRLFLKATNCVEHLEAKGWDEMVLEWFWSYYIAIACYSHRQQQLTKKRYPICRHSTDMMSKTLAGDCWWQDMAAARRSPLAVLLCVAASCYILCSLSLGFVAPVEVARGVEAVASTAGAAPLESLQSSVLMADLSPLENPNISFVVLLSMFSMSIALVVWGRNGF